MSDELVRLIQAFLSERRHSDDCGWATVEQQDLNQLECILYALIEAKWDADTDGDYPIEYVLVDRTKYVRDNFFSIPYVHEANAESRLKIVQDCMRNVLIAQGQLDSAIRYVLDDPKCRRCKEGDRL